MSRQADNIHPVPATAYIGAYWGPREQDLDECADRLELVLADLSRLDGLFAEWYLKGKSRADASQRRVSHDRSDLLALLNAGRQRKDFGGEVMPSLGYHAAMWNRKDASVSLSVACGAQSPVTPNSFIIRLSHEAVDALSDSSQVVVEAMKSVINAWDPDWATLVSHELSDQQDGLEQAGLLAGWITYVKDAHQYEGLPPAARLERWDPGDAIVLAQPFQPIEPDHLLSVQHAAAPRLLSRSAQ
jgi:hypothetical protein